VLIAVLASFTLSWAQLACAQSTSNIARIGFLSFAAPGTLLFEEFRQGLRELGYVEGKNIVIDARFADFKSERLPALAEELVRLNVDVIVTTGTDMSIAAQRATTTIPIVMGAGTDPVAAGLVTSLARPGGNITGLTTRSGDVNKKRLELLKEISPDSSTVAVFWGPTVVGAQLQMKELRSAAEALRVRILPVVVVGPDDYEKAFAEMVKGRADALMAGFGLFGAGIATNRARFIELAAKSRLPTMYSSSEFPEAGGLISYGTSFRKLFRRAAYYVDRILKGAKPADLPIETPTSFELVINLKTAKQLGVTIPKSVLAQADRVIQ
jgi:putative ABC transport system substrate-binding protein